tara:strand:- start:191 stop:418 length:228 start_codon:yes stop_codon:yes gene_type:complete
MITQDNELVWEWKNEKEFLRGLQRSTNFARFASTEKIISTKSRNSFRIHRNLMEIFFEVVDQNYIFGLDFHPNIR